MKRKYSTLQAAKVSAGVTAVTLGLLTYTDAAVPFPSEILEEQGRLTNNAPEWFERFGQQVDLSGDRAAVGAGYPGKVDLFGKQEGAWRYWGTLTQQPNAYGFGEAIALDGPTLAAGLSSFEGTGLVQVYQESTEPGLNAWNTFDNTSEAFSYYRYRRPLTPAEHALATAEGWTLSIRSRFVDDFFAINPSCFVDFTDADDQRYLLWFELDENYELTVTLNGSETLTLTTNSSGQARYHLHQVVFDPATGTADYLFDGEKRNSAPWSPTPITGMNGVRFGNGSTSGSGSQNWNRIELKTRVTGTVLASYDAGTAGNPQIAPDPEAEGWTLEPDNTSGAIGKGPISADFASVWPLETTLQMDDSGAIPEAVALSSEWLVVGMPGAFVGDSRTGTVLVYERDGAQWKDGVPLEPSVSFSGGRFGASLAMDGDRLVVGAPDHFTIGQVFVFMREGTHWVEEAVLESNEPASGDGFGEAVDISGERIVVGAPYDDVPNPSSKGSAYVFEKDGTEWVEEQQLLGNRAGYGFGDSVAIDGDLILVGQGGSSDGAHHLFAPQGGEWVQVHLRVYSGEGLPDPVVQDVDLEGLDFMVGVTDIEVESGPAYVYKINYGNIPGLMTYLRKQLYYSDAEASGTYDPNHTAFRYKHLLYGPDSGRIRAWFDRMADFYGTAEKQTAADVEAELLKGLAVNPGSPELGDLLLDIYYDQAVADTVLARTLSEAAERARFDPPPPGGFVIDNEIPLYRELVETNRNVLRGYFSLLTDDLGVSGDPPLGYRIFRDRVPTRGLSSATTTNDSGEVVPVGGEEILFTGFKDMVLAFDLLRDQGRAAETLARLLIGRDAAGDREEAARVITENERFLLFHGTMLRDLFTDLPPPQDPSGLVQAMGGWEDSLEALGYLEQILAGKVNLLGFDEGFLMFVQKFSGQTEFFDSYDAFRVRLEPDTGSNPLRFALQQLDAAVASYAAYNGFEDELAQQFQLSSISYEDRLRDIVGVFPDDERYSDVPTNNPGSELDQQYRSIELARLQIQRNKVEMNNVNAEIEIEINKAQSVSNVMVRFGEKQAELTRVIGHWNATQAGADALADALSPDKILTGRIFGYAANAAVQATAEEMKAKAEAEKEELAALEQATITGIESEAAVKTMALRLKTLAVESQEAAVLLRQEMNRLVALYREKADLEQKLAERDASFAGRYFADPTHRLRSVGDMVEANLAFEEAQKWLFFMSRALEYKWNTPFTGYEHPANSGRSWSTAGLFKLRNAGELRLLFAAMDDFDSQSQLPKDDYFDWFSVRDDFFGYRLTNDLGQVAVYADPLTGEPVGGIEAFRSRLRQLQDAQGNIRLQFNTVRELPGGTFFRGPRFSPSGQVLSKGLFLDKIRWIKIVLPGDHSLGRSQVSGELRYGGTSFIRNFDVGAYDPAHPERLTNEITGYTTRFWFFHNPSATWRVSEALSSPVAMQLTADPRTPPTVQEIDVFKERSVAASDWLLSMPTRDLGQQILAIDELDDVELYFYHYAVTRP